MGNGRIDFRQAAKTMIYLEPQLQLLHWLEEHRGPWVQKILTVFNFFDSAPFVSFVVLFIWIVYSGRWGARLALLMVISGLVNYFCKQTFGLPRPEFYDPFLPLVHATGFGFPSGGAQNGTLLGGLLAYYSKQGWLKGLGLIFALSVSISRIYLGVHFPLDVLGGIGIGLILLILFILLSDPIEDTVVHHPVLGLSITLTIAGLLSLDPTLHVRRLAGVLAGVSLFLFLKNRKKGTV
jgi:membrane-associated phospholipid phosphatase